MKNYTTNSTMCFTTIDLNKDISKNEASAREIETCKQNVRQRRFHAFKFSDGYKSTMD